MVNRFGTRIDIPVEGICPRHIKVLADDGPRDMVVPHLRQQHVLFRQIHEAIKW